MITKRRNRAALACGPAVAAGLAALTAAPASAMPMKRTLKPGNLLLSTSLYENNPNIVKGVTKLPTGCKTESECKTAVAGGAYPEVFNNDKVDESFGVTSKIILEQLKSNGHRVSSLEVPNSSQPGVTTKKDQMVTSFSSKSEMALNLSTQGRELTFMGYNAPVGAIDVSNDNTPGAVDESNPVHQNTYRVVAQLNDLGQFHFTETNAYSGNNGRAAILNEEDGANLLYAAGNAGNGGKPVPKGIIAGGGAQFITPSSQPELLQNPPFPTPLASFNITQLHYEADKASKDNNFRGIAIYNNVVYYTKGSGGNGIDTVYFVDTTGKACPNGVGLPEVGAPLPTEPLAYTIEKEGLQPQNMCVLKGFNTELAKTSTDSFPFGMWFANADTLYVADEGNGENTYSTTTNEYTAAAAQTRTGLQKWVFDQNAGEWKLAYTIQNGLNLGQPYTVPGYPTGENPATKLPWSPATDGLRNLTGRVSPNGRASIWAVTSTVSGGGDQGADPNKFVQVEDPVGTTTSPPGQHFATVRSAGFGEVLRGVSFTPGTKTHPSP